MAIPVNQSLYNRVKQEAKRKFRVYPSIYANAWLTREYKKRGGKYKNGTISRSGNKRVGTKNSRVKKQLTRKKQPTRKKQSSRKSIRNSVRKTIRKSIRKSNKKSRTTGLTKWFREKWVDACQLPKRVPCGRKKSSMKNYPYCRPSIRVDRTTPKTIHEIPRSILASRCKRKRSNPMKKIR